MGRIDGIVARARGDDDEEIHPHRKKKKKSGASDLFFSYGVIFRLRRGGESIEPSSFFLSACGGSTLE